MEVLAQPSDPQIEALKTAMLKLAQDKTAVSCVNLDIAWDPEFQKWQDKGSLGEEILGWIDKLQETQVIISNYFDVFGFKI